MEGVKYAADKCQDITHRNEIPSCNQRRTAKGDKANTDYAKECCKNVVSIRSYARKHPVKKRYEHTVYGCEKGVFAGCGSHQAIGLECIGDKKQYAHYSALPQICAVHLFETFPENNRQNDRCYQAAHEEHKIRRHSSDCVFENDKRPAPYDCCKDKRRFCKIRSCFIFQFSTPGCMAVTAL